MATIYRVEHADTNEGPFWGKTERISHAIMTYYNPEYSEFHAYMDKKLRG